MRAVLFLGVLSFLLPASAAAQGAPRATGTWFYGISTGLGERTVAGTFSASEEPAGAGQPPSPRATVALNLTGGVGLARRLAVLATYDGGASIRDSHGWGTLAFHAALRAWLTNRVWAEGGVGPAEVAFRPATVSTSTTTYWWAPGVEAAAGYEIFQGPTVTLHAFVQYTEAQFDAVRVQSISVQIGLLGRH